MIKICSLDFITQDIFETDIKMADGRVLYYKGDKITPELILRLYFKEIYAEEAELEEAKSKKFGVADLGIKEKTEKSPRKLEFEASEPSSKSKTDKYGSKSFEDREEIEKEPIEEIIDEDLVFDEEMAKKAADIAVKVGKHFNYTSQELNELEKAAYFYNIGVVRFKKSDLKKKNLKNEIAVASYDILLNEKQMPAKIADTAKFCVYNYESNSFKLSETVPYSHIVGIIRYYQECLGRTGSVEKTIANMLKIGARMFNPFVLHKFIKIIQEGNK